MVSILDVKPQELIQRVSIRLREENIKKPSWVGFVKSGAHAERLPEDENFWWIRCASILRQVYVNGCIGTQRLRTHYGGKKRRGVRRPKHGKTGGAMIRKAFQELESAGLLEKKKEGRVLTPKGRKLLDSVAFEILREKHG